MPVKRKWFWAVGMAMVAVPAFLLWREPWQPLTPSQIARLTRDLMRYGAVDVPHDLAGRNHSEAALMRRVAAGERLSAAESTTYRRAIQAVLADHQTLFSVLDNNIVFALDAGPDDPNNCGGRGIPGQHDLHAASALSNLVELDASLKALETAGTFGRIRHANRAYKSLTDLMVHLAPAVHSVVLADLEPLPPDTDARIAHIYDRFRQAMQAASFADIGSPDYQHQLVQAEAIFATLVIDAQSRITARLSPLEQRLAGRWLSLQSVSPRLSPP